MKFDQVPEGNKLIQWLKQQKEREDENILVSETTKNISDKNELNLDQIDLDEERVFELLDSYEQKEGLDEAWQYWESLGYEKQKNFLNSEDIDQVFSSFSDLKKIYGLSFALRHLHNTPSQALEILKNDKITMEIKITQKLLMILNYLQLQRMINLKITLNLVILIIKMKTIGQRLID